MQESNHIGEQEYRRAGIQKSRNAGETSMQESNNAGEQQCWRAAMQEKSNAGEQ